MRSAWVRAPRRRFDPESIWTKILAACARSQGERSARGRSASLPLDVASGLAEGVMMVMRLPVSKRGLRARTRGQRNDLALQTRARTVTRETLT